MIATVRNLLFIQLHVMIRPRSGDFHYSDDEFRIMQNDIIARNQLGADGVVLASLTWTQEWTADARSNS